MNGKIPYEINKRKLDIIRWQIENLIKDIDDLIESLDLTIEAKNMHEDFKNMLRKLLTLDFSRSSFLSDLRGMIDELLNRVLKKENIDLLELGNLFREVIYELLEMKKMIREEKTDEKSSDACEFEKSLRALFNLFDRLTRLYSGDSPVYSNTTGD